VSLALRVLTFNLLHHPASWPRRAPLVEAGLCALAPDVALLQEVAWPQAQAHALADSLVRATGRAYAVHLTGLLRADGWQEGLAVLSRFPILAGEALAPPGSAAICQRARLDVPGGPLDVYNLHLDPHHDTLRHAQATAVLDWIALGGAPGVVVGGDFNAAPTGGTVSRFAACLRSAYAAVHGREPDRTFPTPFMDEKRGRPGPPPRPATLDYLFVSPDSITVTAADLAFTAPAAGAPTLYPSDHYGLVADLRLVEPGMAPRR
jgi:endonuclease/exonuclease/phosphatase family metal-dependent hydrolase